MATIQVLHGASVLPELKITDGPQYPVSAVAQTGISKVTADLDKLFLELAPQISLCFGQSKNWARVGVHY